MYVILYPTGAPIMRKTYLAYRPIWHLLFSIIIAILASEILYALRAGLTTSIIALLYLVPVIISAAFWGGLAGITTSVLSFLIFNYYFLHPFYTFTVSQPQDILAMFIFLGVAVLISNLMARAQSRLRQVQAREREVLQLYELSAALTGQTVLLSPANVAHAGHTVLGVEAETVYRFDRALPPRDRPYTEEEVLAAVGSVHAAIELVDTHFAVWKGASHLSQIADQFNHGFLIVGSGRETGLSVDASHQPVKLAVNGEIILEQRGGNAAGPSARLLAWLANGGAASQGGIKEGAYVTTGSWTGITFVAPRTRVEVTFEGIGSVAVDIGE